MKRFTDLIDEIRLLSEIDVQRIKNEDADGCYMCIADLEAIFKEFYECGFDNGSKDDPRDVINTDVDFKNRLSNFYQFDTP